MSDDQALIAEARNPIRHTGDGHCPACFGSCGAWGDERAGDPEELIERLADALSAALVREQTARTDALDEAIDAIIPDGAYADSNRAEAEGDRVGQAYHEGMHDAWAALNALRTQTEES